MLKKLLSLILIISILPVIPAGASTSEYDVSVFGNNAEYLLQEHFGDTTSLTAGGENERLISGWDTDYRGGDVRMNSGALRLNDISDKEKISMTHRLLPVKSGELVFETGITIEKSHKSIFEFSLGSELHNVLKFVFEDGNILSETASGKMQIISGFEYDKKISIRANVSPDTKKTELSINNIPYIIDTKLCDKIDRVYFSTGINSVGAVRLHYVNAYINYIINERFMNADPGQIPYGFDFSGSDTSGISYAPGSPYLDDRNGFALENSDLTGARLSSNFENSNVNTLVSWTMLLPEKQDGVCVDIKGDGKNLVDIYTKNGNIYAGDKVIKKDYKSNLWYSFSVELHSDTRTYDINLNYKNVAQDIAYGGGKPDNITFSKTGDSFGKILIDDLVVSSVFEKYEDYPTKPQVAESDDANTGMIMYSMWREGMHFGWDTVSPYEDERKPLMGYYTEGQKEVADWQTKWLSEHGVDYAIYSFVRPNSLLGEPVKKAIRSEDLNDGYMNSLYKSDIKFAVLLSAFGINNASYPADEKKYHGADEFIENMIPYLSEYYFSDPQYMKINNRLPLYVYSLGSMISVFGGASEVKRVLDALDDEAVRLGYDGIMFCADAASSSGHSYVENIAFGESAIWSYGSTSGNVDGIKAKINSEYSYNANSIASIPMGYNDTPWRESYSALMTPGQVSELCEYVAGHDSFKKSPHKMVTFTCWNEYGEGHFYSPSTIGGFGYIDAIRQSFTDLGSKTDNELPTEESVARMEAFYPSGRSALRFRPDQKYTSEYMKNKKLLGRYDFNSFENTPYAHTNCTIEYRDGALEAVATKMYPGIYFDLNTEFDISEVTALRLRARSSGEKFFRVYYTTENNTTEGQGKYFDSTKITRDDGYTDYILYPYKITEDSGYPTPEGKIKRIRISVEDNLYLSGGEFGIDYLEFYGEDSNKDILYRFEPDDSNIKSINGLNANVRFEKGALECEAVKKDSQIYIRQSTGIDISDVSAVKIRAYTLGSTELKMFYITENNTTYGGGKVFVNKSLSGDGVYTDYILTHDNISQMPTGKITAIRIDPADNIYETGAYFGIDRIEFLGKNANQKLILDGTDVQFTTPPITKDGIVYIPVYSVALNEMNAFPVWNEADKTLVTERGAYRLKVTEGSRDVFANGRQLVWSGVPFKQGGNLFVPCEEFLDAIGYDVIWSESANTFIATSKTDFAISAKGFEYGDNIIIHYPDSQDSDYMISNGSGQVLVENTDGEETLKLQPTSAGSDMLFTARYVNYNGVRTRLDDIIKLGTLMKVSFSFKGVCNGFNVENRSGNSIDLKASRSNFNPNNWNEFTYVFDNSKINVTDDARWLTIRVKSDSDQDPYLYIKNYNVTLYQEGELKTFDGEFDTYLSAPTNQLNPINYRYFAAEYDSLGRLVSVKNIKEGSTEDSGEEVNEYKYTPGDGACVKLFLWSDTKPLCKIKELYKR